MSAQMESNSIADTKSIAAAFKSAVPVAVVRAIPFGE